MAAAPFNSVGGFTIGIPPFPVIDAGGNILATTVSTGALSVFGDAQISGNIVVNTITGNLRGATSALTVTSAAQPNITSLGTLTGLQVDGDLLVGGVAVGRLYSPQIVAPISMALLPEHSGMHMYHSSLDPITISVSVATSDSLPIGSEFRIVNDLNAGEITLTLPGQSDVIIGSSRIATLMKITGTRWAVTTANFT